MIKGIFYSSLIVPEQVKIIIMTHSKCRHQDIYQKDLLKNLHTRLQWPTRKYNNMHTCTRIQLHIMSSVLGRIRVKGYMYSQLEWRGTCIPRVCLCLFIFEYSYWRAASTLRMNSPRLWSCPLLSQISRLTHRQTHAHWHIHTHAQTRTHACTQKLSYSP
jgi:hypothetical protein